jgi:hypothetical protein
MESVAHDRCTLLGDYFDDFYDSPEENVRCTEWLNGLPEIVDMLIGNHDLHYRYTSQRCSGWTIQKAWAIAHALNKSTWDRMRVFHRDGDYLLSHAGFHPQLLKDDIDRQQPQFLEYMQYVESKNATPRHDWLNIPRIRGGFNDFGGPFWQDWREAPDTPGQKQIFGHTPAASVRHRKHLTCLDTHMRNYAVIEDGQLLSVRKTPEKFFKP